MQKTRQQFCKALSRYWNIQRFLHSVFTFLGRDVHRGQQLTNIKTDEAKTKAIHNLLL